MATSKQAIQSQLSAAASQLENLNTTITGLNSDIQTLQQARRDADNAVSRLSQAMSGDYSSFSIISSENKGDNAKKENQQWTTITDDASQIKKDADNAVQDIQDALETKQRHLDDATTSLQLATSSMAQLQIALQQADD